MSEAKQLTPQVLAMYLGCRVKTDTGIIGKLVTVDLRNDLVIAEISAGMWQTTRKPISKVKPILRKLSSMTEEEAVKMYNHLWHNVNISDKAKAENIFADILKGGNYWEGKVSSLDYINQIVYMLSKSFDLFGLLDSGLAIDASTLNPDKP